MIRLEASATQLLLFVPYSENARAKSIEGRRWEPSRKAWAYPLTVAAYDAIVAEFGSEIVDNRVPRPHDGRRPRPLPDQNEVVADALRRENEALRRDIQGLRQSVEQVVASTKGSAAVADLRQTILARETEIAQLREHLAVARSRIQELELAEKKLQQSLSGARAARLRRAAERVAARPPVTKANGLTAVRQFVQDHLDPKCSLHGRLEALSGGEYTSIDIGKVVESELRTRLGAYDGQGFHDLINHAFDTELLSQEGKDFAHTIRKQRNNVAHDNVTKQSFLLRGALSLVSASLLWSDFD